MKLTKRAMGVGTVGGGGAVEKPSYGKNKKNPTAKKPPNKKPKKKTP